MKINKHSAWTANMYVTLPYIESVLNGDSTPFLENILKTKRKSIIDSGQNRDARTKDERKIMEEVRLSSLHGIRERMKADPCFAKALSELNHRRSKLDEA